MAARHGGDRRPGLRDRLRGGGLRRARGDRPLPHAPRRQGQPGADRERVRGRLRTGGRPRCARPRLPLPRRRAARGPRLGRGGGLMPRRDDIEKILLLGSGPIVIGQAAEFDYSGVQACKVLLEDGYEVVLVNSNPATIMTDPEFAHRTYVEPLLPESVAGIVQRERPDALLPTLGGQTALNLAKALHDDGTLDRFGVELIGANYEAIHRAEDREAFRATMEGAGLRVPWSVVAGSVSDAERELAEGRISLPAIVRPAFTLGGEGGGVARDREGIERAGAAIEPELEFRQVVSEGLAASPINQVLIEESVLGWGEFELEVMRDRNDNVVVICSIENVD